MALFDNIPKAVCPEGITETPFECTRGGLTIRGTEYRPAGENLPVAIVSHGFMGFQDTVRQYTINLAEMGYCAYCFDFCGGSIPGKGASDGATTEMSVLTEVSDLEAVITYARSQAYTGEELLLMGCSQGGFVSALTAVKPEWKVSKLVLFYPALCIPDDARAGRMMFARFDPNNIPEIIDCGPMKLGRHYAAEMLDLEPYKDIAGYTGPVLIVHGTADVIVNVEYAKKAAAAYEATAADRLTLVIIPEGAHGFRDEHDAIATAAVAKFAAL